MRRWVGIAGLSASLLAPLAGCGSGPDDLSGRACLARLDDDRVDYRALERVSASDSRCRVDTAVRVTRIAARFNAPATMGCALAARLDEFERKVVQPLALAELGRRIVRLNHLGSFSCRATAGRRDRLSQHALGRAIDIAGFELSDGSSIDVRRDWSPPGPKRLFLRRLASRACEYFSVVLTPDSDGAHHNHIHLDIGPDRLCSV